MQEDRLGLAWHKFLIYCGIWICMLLCAGEAVLWFSGKAYGQILYHTRRGLRLFDIVIAVLYLANIVLLVFARRGLANQSPHATETLHIAFVFMGSHALLSCLISSLIAGRSFQVVFSGSFSFVLAIIGFLGWIVNMVYYRKRKRQLFL